MNKMKNNENSINFLKIRDVKSPNRAYEFDAGIDFFVPKFNTKFIEDIKNKNECLSSITSNISYNNVTCTIAGTSNNEIFNYLDSHIIKFDEEKGLPYFNLAPNEKVLIPSGIKTRMTNNGRALVAFNKSGIASKLGLIVGACVIDATYKGEVHINMINTSNKIIRIYEDMKIVQFIELSIFNNQVNVFEQDEVDEKDFYKGVKDDRKDGGFGSTNKLVKQINS